MAIVDITGQFLVRLRNGEIPEIILLTYIDSCIFCFSLDIVTKRASCIAGRLKLTL